MRAPGRTPEGITYRTGTRRAAVAAGALLLVVSTSVNPSFPILDDLPAPEPPAAVVQQMLAERAERAVTPPAARRGAPVRVRPARVRLKPVSTVRTHRPVQRSMRFVRASAIVRFGAAQVGDPYVYGAAGPGSWDCSGLTKRAFARAGIVLPRRARDQSARGRAVSRRAARVADLALWGGVGDAYHVAIYLGGGWILHSPRPGQRVKVAKVWGRPQFRRLV